MNLKNSHLNDLEKSGLSLDTIQRMNVTSRDGDFIARKIHHKGDVHYSIAADGYEIPYIDKNGNVLFTRYKMFWPSWNNEQELPKYLTEENGSWDIYIPPFAYDLIEKSQFIIITEGEKKAAKACQEGIPCVAIPGVYMWMDKVGREKEKSLEYPISFKTPLLEAFEQFKDKKLIIAFDSDAKSNINVFNARKLFKDALLFQCASWVKIMDLPEKEGEKMGLDDWLMDPIGYDNIGDLIHRTLSQNTDTMSPLIKFPYKETITGSLLHYIIPNTPKHEKFAIHQIIKEVESPNKDGMTVIEYKQISATRVWLNRLVKSIDGDNKTLYEVAYIPLDQREPQYLSGGSEIIRFSSKNGDDIFSDYGARILSKDKPQIEEFINDCQTYGIRSGAVKSVLGTKRRGWLIDSDQYSGHAYIMANKLITPNSIYAAASPKIPLLPVEAGNDSAMKEALVKKGNFDTWKEMIYHHVFTSPLPAILLSASMAGLLRKWCPDSENFIVHLYGESSHGKTTALRLAASAWGLPEKIIDNWRSTDNGLERRCASRNDMVMMLDEAGMAQSEEIIKNSVYMIGNGGEKLRANKDSTDRISRRFQLVALSTGEKQLIRDAKFAGQEVRTIELNANAIGGALWHNIKNGEDAEKLNFHLSNNYGWSVEKFIQSILFSTKEDPNFFHENHLAFTQKLRTYLPSGTPAHISRRVKHFGLIVTTWHFFLKFVMELAEQDIEKYSDWMIQNIGNNLLQLDTDQFKMGENEGILHHLLTSVTKHQHKFYSSNNDTLKGDVYGVIEDDKICVIPSGLSEIAKPFDNARVVYIADSIGALIYNKDKKKQDKKMTRRIGSMRADCYIFDIKKIEEFLKK